MYMLLALLIDTTAFANFVNAKVKVTGVTCSMCSNSVNKALSSLTFVDKIDVDLENDLTSKESKQKIEHLDLTSPQKIRVGLFLAVMPLLILCLGILVWLRRRS